MVNLFFLFFGCCYVIFYREKKEGVFFGLVWGSKKSKRYGCWVIDLKILLEIRGYVMGLMI